ncbi:MAG TPA: riboflavin synthase [Ignavibacteriales bacterium]|nr:riboflavin synthase [Ignavibacteriales bacterium]HOL81745.1 riboflavin synthase [Ignavibacteriales bacterium]HOM65696.1 riboflavin synthase [Ignavibacteriales bacterium]HPD67392.1 riboflavin synthase [Ignavibacteriales bacterium]HPP32917.1 riboflavin synthase [Ignavibacteriales bacterium]
MFTGLIEEIGKVIKIQKVINGVEYTISCSKVLENIEIGDSIAVNGVCQTVTKFDNNSFTVFAVEETLLKTTLKNLSINQFVNLETSLTLNKKIGGHIVYGHVDTTGQIVNIQNNSSEVLLSIQFDREYSKYLIHVGSIAIDGVSLTIAKLDDNNFTVAIIPHTFENTIFKFYKKYDFVNLEFDVIGKYVEKQLGKVENKSKITEEWLKQHGF